MSYTLIYNEKETDPGNEKIVLRPARAPRIIFWSALILFPLYGIGMALFGYGNYHSLYGALVPPGFALLAVAGAMLYQLGRSERPEQMEFLFRQRLFRVKNAGLPDLDTGFTEFVDFNFRRKGQGRFVLHGLLKDHSYWDMTVTSFKRRAIRERELLRKRIKPGGGTKGKKRGRAQVRKPARLKQGRAGNADVYYWSEKLSFRAALYINLAFLGLALALPGAGVETGVLQGELSVIVPLIVLLSLAQVFLFIMALKLRGRTHYIRVTPERIYQGALSWKKGEELPPAGKKERSFPRETLARVQFNFDLDQGVQNIWLLDTEEETRLTEMRTRGLKLKEAPSFWRFSQKIFKIPLFGLSCYDALVLRDQLQKFAPGEKEIQK